GVRRAQTVRMCADLGIGPWDDPHNTDPGYTRVRVRSEVLPLLEEVLGGGVAQALARTADQLREDGTVLDALAEDLRCSATIPSPDAGAPLPVTGVAGAASGGSGLDDTDRPRLSIEILTTAPAALRRRAVRAWLTEQGIGG